MVDTVRVTALETQAIIAGQTANDTIRITGLETQAIIAGQTELDQVRVSAIEMQAVTSIFNKRCVIAVSC